MDDGAFMGSSGECLQLMGDGCGVSLMDCQVVFLMD